MKEVKTIQDLHKLKKKNVLLIPIPKSPVLHRINTDISFVCIYNISDNDILLVKREHSDLDGKIWPIFIKFEFEKKVFVYKKYLLEKFFPDALDVELINWLVTNKELDISYPEEVSIYHYWYRDNPNVNTFVPVVTLISYCENIIRNFNNIDFSKLEKKSYNFYSKFQKTLYRIEENGLKVIKSHPKNPQKNSDILYSKYKMFTSTGRPSNTFGGFNFAAMPKNDNTREMFVSRFEGGMLLEFDYDSYHVQLVADLLDYDFGGENIHDYLGQQYFNVKKLTPEQYDESKQLTFRLLYGKNVEGVQEVEFFGRVYALKDWLWRQWNDKGYIRMPISKRKIRKENFDSMNKDKLFNYLIQGHETEVNSLVLDKLNQYLLNGRSCIVLYTYDSVLIDYCPEDGRDFIKNVRKVIEDGRYSATIKYGLNYNNMKKASYE